MLLRKHILYISLLLIAFPLVLHADVVTDWNNIALDAVKTAKQTSVTCSRTLAMVHTAVYDSVNSISGSHQSYRYNVAGYSTASKEAAAVSAAHRVLSSLFPAQAAALDASLNTSLSSIADGAAKTQGITLGQTVADSVLSWRSMDHSMDMVMFSGGTNPGQWRPTPPGYADAMMPQWGNVTPFAMTSGSQFRLAAPPALDSVEYAQALNEVKDLGMKNSLSRSATQTETAYFWADSPGTVTTAGRWNLIAQQAAQEHNNTLEENARLFALLNISLADAGISAWDTKYHYAFWRPITAIREAGSDGNALTDEVADWTPELMTPAFPECGSAHSTFSGAAAEALKRFFNSDDAAITIASYSNPAVTRDYLTFTQIADEAGISRIYGGIHFSFSNINALAGGRDIAAYVSNDYLQAVPEPSSLVVIASGLLGLTGVIRRKK